MDLSSSVAFRSAKERQTNATFAERKATMYNKPMVCTQFSFRPSWKDFMAEKARRKNQQHPDWFES